MANLSRLYYGNSKKSSTGVFDHLIDFPYWFEISSSEWDAQVIRARPYYCKVLFK